MPGRIRCLLPNPNSDTTIFFQPPENAYKALNLNLMHLPIHPLQNRASGFSEPFRLWFAPYLAAISHMGRLNRHFVGDHLEQLTHTLLVRSQLLIGPFSLELMWLLIGEWGSFANIPELD